MRVTLCYPPVAYATMPYLAPFLLKGYLGEVHGRRADVHDLNIAYHRHVWSGAWATGAAGALAAAGDRGGALIAELLALRGEAAWAALRDDRSFADAARVQAYTRLLREAPLLAERLDRARGHGPPRLPDACGGWRRVLDELERTELGRFLERALARAPYADADVLGLAPAYIEQLAPALLTARLFKRRDPGRVVILGGNALTHYVDEFRRDDGAWADLDYAVPFEGEWELGRLLDRVERGEGPPATNVMHRGRDGIRYRKSLAERPHVEATPDFSDLVHDYPTPRPIYPLLTSKGCYWGKCAFCTHHEGYGQGVRMWGAERVDGTVRGLVDRGAREFYFVDEALPMRTLRRLGAAFAGVEGVAWMAEARVERPLERPDTAQELAASGCRMLISGVESGDQAVVDRMRKGIDLAATARFARQASAAGVRIGWMFFVGFPGETEAQAEQTFRFIAEHADALDLASVGTFSLERGSPAFERPHEVGIAEIEEPGRDYPLGFDYRVADGSPVSQAALRDRLAALRRRHAALTPLFSGVGDRGYGLFLPPGVSSRGTADASPAFTWTSAIAPGEVRLDLQSRRLEVHASKR